MPSPTLTGTWQQRTDSSGFVPHMDIPLSVGPLTLPDIRFVNYIGIQGVNSTLYVYGAPPPAVKEGDQFIFSETVDGPVNTWPALIVFEITDDWYRVGVSSLFSSAIVAESGVPLVTEGGATLRLE